MSAAYQPPMPAYDGRSHIMHNYSSALSHGSQVGPLVDDARGLHNGYHQQSHHQPSSNLSHAAVAETLAFNQPSTPTDNSAAMAASTTRQRSNSRGASDTLIYHSLHIPKCISPSGGNLSDFAAQMTCLFWFETVDDLKRAAAIRMLSPNEPYPRLPALARPYEQFRKWVYSVLSTTQVTQNVIFLALLFIYRLKMSTPQIKGRAGSEYRLLTVALMLGNKFLDDNTYTNKTWAEVSCFAVQEIHVMEVEFLSNMRYNLLTSKEEWNKWISKLGCFHEYYDRALKMPSSPVANPSPTGMPLHSPTSSPVGAMIQALTPSGAANLSPVGTQTRSMAAYRANNTSPLASKPAMPLPLNRKRSPDGDMAEHPAKRAVPPNAQTMQMPANSRLNGAVEGSRLPMPPHLSLVTNHMPAAQYPGATGYPPQAPGPSTQGVVSLPPLNSGMRAMATVYQNSPSSASFAPEQTSHVPIVGPVVATNAAPTSGYQSVAMPIQTPTSYGTPTKHHSPGHLAPNTYTSSPLVEAFGPASAIHTPGIHTPISNSPSVFLQHRASPYRPIRHVNRLLYPPPSASLEQYHISVPLPPNQMHYQPLGRRHDLRTGIVPEFLMSNRGQQLQMNTPGGTGSRQQGQYPS